MHHQHFLRRSHGSTLLTVMGFVTIATGLLASVLSLASNHRKLAVRQLNMEQALYVAEGGLERGIRTIESNILSLVASTTGTNGAGTLGSGTYTFSVSKISKSVFSISSTGFVNNVRRSVSIKRIYQPTYAEFALWSEENGALYFKDGEEFDGHVHANDRLYFNVSGGGPVFHAPVTSGAGTYTVQGGSINAVQFDEGFEMNSYQGSMMDVDFNSAAADSLKNIAQSSGLVLEGATTLTFSGSSVQITNTRKGWTNQAFSPSAEGIIYIANATSGTTSTRTGHVYLVGGTVSGRLSVVTEGAQYIRGHIRYANDPRTNPSSTDALGLIARDDVWVDTTAPNNLEINAAVLAAGTVSASNRGSFGVLNFNSGSARGVLTVHGGIVQDQRGAVGTFNSSTGVTSTGFGKNYSYDPRFVEDPPPYYPAVVGKIEFAEWREGR